MENASREGGQENSKRRKGILVCGAFTQEKGESNEQAEKQSCDQRMKIRPIESEKCGRAKIRAQRIDVGDGAPKEHGDSRGVRGSTERVISYRAMRRQLARCALPEFSPSSHTSTSPLIAAAGVDLLQLPSVPLNQFVCREGSGASTESTCVVISEVFRQSTSLTSTPPFRPCKSRNINKSPSLRYSATS